jgi:hypothetical protein
MIRIENPDVRFILVRLGILAAAVAFVSLVAVLVLGTMNDDSEGSSPATGEPEAGTTDPYSELDSLWQGSDVALPEQQMMSEGPESSWEVSPCSIYVDGGSRPVVDMMPESPGPEGKPLEALLVVKRWAAESGLGEEYLDDVYVFTRLDTIYVDLPSPLDVEGLELTVESRFICFTRLFPLVAGNLLSSWPEGLPLRGVPGVFRN